MPGGRAALSSLFCVSIAILRGGSRSSSSRYTFRNDRRHASVSIQQSRQVGTPSSKDTLMLRKYGQWVSLVLPIQAKLNLRLLLSERIPKDPCSLGLCHDLESMQLRSLDVLCFSKQHPAKISPCTRRIAGWNTYRLPFCYTFLFEKVISPAVCAILLPL